MFSQNIVQPAFDSAEIQLNDKIVTEMKRLIAAGAINHPNKDWASIEDPVKSQD